MTVPTVTSLPDGSVLLEVLVQPRASREGVAGLVDGRLKIRLTAPPVDGEANAQLVAFLARQLGVARSAVELVRGQTGRRKAVRVSGATPAALAALTGVVGAGGAGDPPSRPAVWLALALGAALLCGNAACSGTPEDSLLTLSVLTPDGSDPFEGAERARLIVDADPTEAFDLEASDEDGYTTFSTDFSLEQATDMMGRAGPITLLVFDGNDRLIARGRTPVVSLAAQEAPVLIWVNRIGRSSAVPERNGVVTSLSGPRVDATAAVLQGVGPLIVGGRDSAGDVRLEGSLYNTYYHRVDDLGNQLELRQARALPAASATDDGRLLVVGGEGGEADDPAPFFNAEILTPIVDSDGVRFNAAPPVTDLDMDLLARAGASFAATADGELFLVGGYDEGDDRRPEVLRVMAVPLDDENTESNAEVAVDSPFSLATPRLRPAAVVLEGAGKLLVLGGAEDDKAPAGERLDLGGGKNDEVTGDPLPQQGVVAAPVSGIAAVATGWLEADRQPTTSVALVVGTTITVHDKVLSVPRSGPTVTAFELGGDGEERRVLVAGGLDADGNPLDTADVLSIRVDDNRIERVGEPVTLTQARARHVAALLPTGDILLAGGLTSGGEPTDTVELYTPCSITGEDGVDEDCSDR